MEPGLADTSAGKAWNLERGTLNNKHYISSLIIGNMENMTSEEMQDLILNYDKKEYIDDEDLEFAFNIPLLQGGYLDSFSMVSLLVFLEHKFKIKIPSSQAIPKVFDSVNDIATLVDQNL